MIDIKIFGHYRIDQIMNCGLLRFLLCYLVSGALVSVVPQKVLLCDIYQQRNEDPLPNDRSLWLKSLCKFLHKISAQMKEVNPVLKSHEYLKTHNN